METNSGQAITAHSNGAGHYNGNGTTHHTHHAPPPPSFTTPAAILPPAAVPPAAEPAPVASAASTAGVATYQVVRRNGAVVPFDGEKINIALLKAFMAVRGAAIAQSSQVRELVNKMSAQVLRSLTRNKPYLSTFHIEDIQDQVELALMREEQQDVARAYVLYREERARARQASASRGLDAQINVRHPDGRVEPLDVSRLVEQIEQACEGLSGVDPQQVAQAAVRDLYNNIPQHELETAVYMAARGFICLEPEYSQVCARLLLDALRSEIFARPVRHGEMTMLYPDHFRAMLARGVDGELLNPALLTKFDLDQLAAALDGERDLQFNYLGLQTLYDRYFLKDRNGRIEMPQSFFMRVAMGLALDEDDPTARALEFYHLLSTFRFMSSTPTLFNSGTLHSQLSSCYLTTVGDDLADIFSAYQENALLAKFAGGLGNDWTPVRAMGSQIKGTNGESQGVIPFLKIVNDTALAVNQGGKRKGAVCVYLETWHADILDFIELRKNTGDERRRTHDMNTANWIPDLFMKRVSAGAQWTLFSPSDVPDLHDLFGAAFEKRYEEYEAMVDAQQLPGKRVDAVELWRKMLTMLFETGHPWMTFKDACNVRSPQQHVGVIHSSNLCTEITLNTNADEIAVCNLGSVNLLAHLADGGIDEEQLAATIRVAMRMLDNVIDINYYAVDKAANANAKHRPVGLGMMGFQDCLYELQISYNSQAAVEFADRTTEVFCYHAYWASSELARARGAYSSFVGSLWDRGIMPHDTLTLLARERGESVDGTAALMSDTDETIDGDYLAADISTRLDWDALRAQIRKHGMRNSNCVAIAPTATIANIVGVTASIEPTYQNIFVKSNLSGDFTVSNRHLVAALRAEGLWDKVLYEDILYADGLISKVERIPSAISERFPTVFEIDPVWLVECAARRQKWIDQAQSLNLYVASPKGKKLDELYRLAWRRGLKTTYYLRSMGASSTEKYGAKSGAHNAVAAHLPTAAATPAAASSPTPPQATQTTPTAQACAMDDPDCEACQ